MAEPKYYDELPTYIMHSDGEFKEGVFKAVDGSGNSLTIGTEKNVLDKGKQEKLTIEGADKAEFGLTYVQDESGEGAGTLTLKSGTFSAGIGEIAMTIEGGTSTFGTESMESLYLIFKKGEDEIKLMLPSLATLQALMQALNTRIERLIAKNIKDGTGTGGVISGTISGENTCVASGENSFAGGFESTASGENSFAFGDEATASGVDSFAVGNGSATGAESCAANYGIANGPSSFACNGGKTVGDNSFAAGHHTNANGWAQTVIGKYNIEQGSVSTAQPTDNVFIIGNGTGINARSNALAVRWDGAIVLANGTVLTVEQLAKVANLT